MKQVTVNFVKRVYLAITDFRWYPYAQRENMKIAIQYLLKLIATVSIIMALVVTSHIVNDAESVIERFTEIYREYEQNTNITTMDMVVKESITDILFGIKDKTISPVIVYAYVLASIYITYLIVKAVNILILLFVAQIINILFGAKLKLADYIKIITYAITLPIIIEAIAIAITGRIPDYAQLAYHALSYVYIFYAIRAIKLDTIIIQTPGQTVKEKLENAIQKVEEEIENEMKKKEEKERHEEENEKENKEKTKDEKNSKQESTNLDEEEN